MADFVTWVMAWYNAHIGFGSVVVLMTIESSFIPFPSEVVIPPAAYLAGDPTSAFYVTESPMLNAALIVLAGTIGALIGAVINYVLALWLGRPIMYAFADSKVGHLCLLSGEKLQRAEDYFNDHGKVSTLVGRLIPAIRQLISIPAGLSKMHFGAFLGYTALGAAIWNTVLATLGYIAQGNKEMIQQYSHELSAAILILLVAVILYWMVKKIAANASVRH